MRRPIPIRLLLAGWLMALAWVYMLFGARIANELDAAWLDWERSKRLARFKLSLPIEGTPDVQRLEERLSAKGLTLGAPVFIRVFKLESELELWLEKGERFELFATYPVCRWSGALGPKLREGDKQSPEGFYAVGIPALNPNSRWHRSFNLGFPNAYDRAHARTGSFIMVHGGCSSVGCFAMTDPVVGEIWRLVTASLAAGQERFHVHVFPFRMTERRLAQRKASKWAAFWADLRPGYDLFESARVPPRVLVCNGRYHIFPGRPGGAGNEDVAEGCAAAAART